MVIKHHWREQKQRLHLLKDLRKVHPADQRKHRKSSQACGWQCALGTSSRAENDCSVKISSLYLLFRSLQSALPEGLSQQGIQSTAFHSQKIQLLHLTITYLPENRKQT